MKVLITSIFLYFLCSCSKKIEILPLESYYTYEKIKKIDLSILGVQDSVIYIHDSPKSYNYGLIILDSLNKPIENIYNFEKLINGQKVTDSTFTPTAEGTYSPQVKLGSISSNIKKIKVYDLKKHISKINLEIPFGNQFKANGTAPIPLIASIENDLNLKIDSFIDLKYIINGKESSYSKIITSNTIGNYEISLKGYSKESNKIMLDGVDKNSKVKYRIPVIVHMLNFETDSEKIKKILDGANKVFKNKTYKNSDLYPYYVPDNPKNINSDDLEIEFYPAENSPNGSKLESPGLNIINGPSKDYATEDIAKIAPDWDINRFFNIHMFIKSNCLGTLFFV